MHDIHNKLCTEIDRVIGVETSGHRICEKLSTISKNAYMYTGLGVYIAVHVDIIRIDILFHT